MKKFLLFLVIALVALYTAGCSTIYEAAVDERNVSTIASDKVIEVKILKKMADVKSGDLVDVSVTSYQGNVFLVGEYENLAQKNRFLSAAKSIEGVRSVKSYFLQADKNSPCDTQKNLGITAKVKAALIGDKSIWSTNVKVSTMQCKVVLWGTVGSSAEVTKSIAHAKSVAGVKSVKSFLKYKK
jgi:hyperosmotically inducible periplasmic protein